MNEVDFNIRLYLTGMMKSWTGRIGNASQRYVLSAMTELFDSLSDDDIELTRLRYVEHLTLAEVASLYLITERTVRNHTNPTVKKLKEIIKQATEQTQHARESD